MEDAEIDVELSRIRERARETYWRNWLLQFVPIYTALNLLFRLSGHDRHDSVWTSLLGLAIGFAIVGGLLLVASRRRWRLLPEPPLSAGLPRPRRSVVRRDLRRGTPNADPLLRAVEDAVAAKYRRSGPAAVWLCAIFAAGFALYALFGDDVVARVMSVLGAAAVVGGAVRQVQLNRGMCAFGSPHARA